jgi:hypothetical protein
MRSLFEEAKAIYAPEGKYMTGIEAGLERGEKKAIAGGMQGLAAAGLAGTSMMGGLAKKYQEEVAAPEMARATTQRLSAMAGILSQEAGMEGSMATRTQTTTSPLARAYGGGGGGDLPGFGTGRAAGYRPPAAPTRTPAKAKPLSLNLQPFKAADKFYVSDLLAKTVKFGPSKIYTDADPGPTGTGR